MAFSGPQYWSGQPIPSPGDLPDPGIKPGSPAQGSPALQADSLPIELLGKPIICVYTSVYIKYIFIASSIYCKTVLYINYLVSD